MRPLAEFSPQRLSEFPIAFTLTAAPDEVLAMIAATDASNFADEFAMLALPWALPLPQFCFGPVHASVPVFPVETGRCAS